MVDLKKLREAKKQLPVVDPVEIFRRLPKSARIKDLYGSQVEVLQAWFNSRTDKDHVLKLHTGGGKTLVGLLIAQSILNETGEPVLHICPNNQLVAQTLEKAQQYSLPAVQYEKPFPDDFLNGRSVLVANYSHLFNGMSRFGTRGKDFINLGGLIVDDAHVGSNVLRDGFTIRLKRSEEEEEEDGKGGEVYETVAATFRYAFKELGQLGTFDDVVSGGDYAVLEVPYWAWQDKLDVVQAFLKDKAEGRYELVWPLLRDNLKHCHCLITQNSIAVTPIFPLVDLIPAFSECKRRIFMSATIPDDSEIVRSFDAMPEALQKPLVSKSLAGVSERMILVPELMEFKFKDVLATLRGLAQNAARSSFSTVILVPSGYAAKTWTEVASYPDSPKAVEAVLKELVEGKTHGPVVFASRYDGIDLPDNSCRMLILSGLPRAVAEYETHRANSFAGASLLNRAIAQKIEQGMGRAEASRPEKLFGNGPDVLWIISKTTGLIIEAKSRKNQANALTKEQHGQLLVAENWFKGTYKGMTGIRVSVHPNVTATKNAVPSRTKALTLAKLNELIAEARKLITAICESGHPDDELPHYCEDLLKKSNLTPERLVEHYLTNFEVQEVG